MSRTAVIVSNAEDSRALCRLCMIYHEYFVNIFIPNSTFRICAEEAIYDLLSLKVALGDGLPSNICHHCVKKLIEFRDFKEICLKTAAELRKGDFDNFLKVSKIKDEDAADVETSREGSSHEKTFLNDMHVTEVYITTPDELAIGNVSHAKEELWSSENALVVKEEVNDGEHRIEGFVQVNALTSVAVDPLAVNTMALKEEDQEPKGAAGEGSSLGDTYPHNHIQVTEVFVPMPDQLAIGNVRYAEEDSGLTELMAKKEIGEGLDGCENDVLMVSLSRVNVDPLAVDNTMDIKVDDDIKMGDCSLNMEVRREEGLLENEGSGKECSDGGAPLSATEPENQVDCCNSIGGIPEVPEIYLNKLLSGRQKHSQHQLTSNSLYDHMRDGDLQFECSVANSLAAPCHSGKIVKRKKNIKPCVPNNISSPSNDLKQLKCDHCGKDFRYRYELKRHLVIHTGVKPFKCKVCGKNCAQKSDLKKHFVIHTGVKPFKCNVCEKNFSRKSDLKKHLVIHTGVKAFKCNICGKYLTEKGSLKRHLVIHTGVKPFKCNMCGKNFTQKGNLKEHLIKQTCINPNKCAVGGKTFTRSCNLSKHSVVHTGEKPFKCNVCGNNFARKGDLKRHLALHTGVKPYECAVCGRTFARSDTFATHSVIHTGEKPLKCNVCGKKYTLKSSLRVHLVKHTGVKPYKCAICGKTFSRSGHLSTHSVVHTGEKPFKCNVCGKNFDRKGNLKTHVVIHTGVKPYKCDVCGKMFTQKNRLKKHLIIHTGLKPYKCEVCGKMFYQKGSLNRHLIIHTGMKPYKCDVCGKIFTQKDRLNKHLTIHTGLKPYKCEVCEKTFTRKGSLNKHLIIHTGVKPYKCEVCGKMFTYKCSLKKHLVIHIGINSYKCDLCGKEYQRKRNLRGHLFTHASLKPPI